MLAGALPAISAKAQAGLFLPHAVPTAAQAALVPFRCNGVPFLEHYLRNHSMPRRNVRALRVPCNGAMALLCASGFAAGAPPACLL